MDDLKNSNMDRRKFLQQTTAAASLTALGAFTLPSFTTNKKKHITILHTIHYIRTHTRTHLSGVC